MSSQVSSPIVLIDIDNLLIKPCLPLFPEWGTRFFAVSKNDKSQLWLTIDYLLSMNQHKGLQPEIWLLSSLPQTLNEVLEQLNIPALRHALQVLKRIHTLVEQHQLTVTNIVYHHCREINTSEHSHLTAIHLVTRFEVPMPKNDTQLSRQWLLPMGLRALFKQKQLLGRQLASIRQLSVVGDGKTLMQAVMENRHHLSIFSYSLMELKKNMNKQLADWPIQSLAAEQTVNKVFELATIKEAPSLPFFYRKKDEQTIDTWVEQIDSYPTLLALYNTQCYDDYLSIINAIDCNEYLTSDRAQDWLIRHGKEGKDCSHQLLLAVLNQEARQLKATSQTANFNLPPADNHIQFSAIERNKNKTKENVKELLINSCRRRPTPFSFWILIFLPIIFTTITLLVGKTIPPIKDMPYQNLLSVIGVIGLGWIVVVGLKWWHVNQRFKKDGLSAVSKLALFRNQLLTDAKQICSLAQSLLALTVSQNNSNALLASEQSYQEMNAKIHYHLREIETNEEQFGENTPVSAQYSDEEKIPLSAQQLNNPIEQQEAYRWRGHSIPELYQGKSKVEINNQEEYKRYPGVKQLIFLGR